MKERTRDLMKSYGGAFDFVAAMTQRRIDPVKVYGVDPDEMDEIRRLALQDDPDLARLLTEEEMIDFRAHKGHFGDPVTAQQMKCIRKIVFASLDSAAESGYPIGIPRLEAQRLLELDGDLEGFETEHIEPHVLAWIEFRKKAPVTFREKAWSGPEQVKLADGMMQVTFRWSVDHGPCENCGIPAAFYVLDAYGDGNHMPVCSVCAANEVADNGSEIEHIE